VKDEGHTYKGLAAIKQWKAGASKKYSYTSEPFASDQKEGKTVITSRLVGNFPGSPVNLRFFFGLEGDKIKSLEIIPWATASIEWSLRTRQGQDWITLDPHWHIFSERVPGTFADYVAMPKRNAIVLPEGLSALNASVLGTAWLTAYRALFTKSNLKPGQTLLVQGASGGMSTALIQLGRAAGFEVWTTSRNRAGRALAERLGAHRTFDANDLLPRKVQTVISNVGRASWDHSLASVARGGTIVVTGGTTGMDVGLSLLPIISDQITVCGSIMGTHAPPPSEW
jgi:hypothetical protein